jgi:hypothetical protein
VRLLPSFRLVRSIPDNLSAALSVTFTDIESPSFRGAFVWRCVFATAPSGRERWLFAHSPQPQPDPFTNFICVPADAHLTQTNATRKSPLFFESPNRGVAKAGKLAHLRFADDFLIRQFPFPRHPFSLHHRCDRAKIGPNLVGLNGF